LNPDHVHALGMISIEMANLEMHLGSLLGALTHVGTFQLNAGSGCDDSRASVYAEETTSPGSALRAGDHDVSLQRLAALHIAAQTSRTLPCTSGCKPSI
jgi:hypothetical protein